uniref:Uncharacterized protein n=1 Tax=uncultured Desulfobacterium sp. TaxID=201089 RepID=E1Y9M1_9BACT|nr:unknown protein [uncultured Desulfobacterium sp.]
MLQSRGVFEISSHKAHYRKKQLENFTRRRPYYKDDNVHIEQKNWTHVRQ